MVHIKPYTVITASGRRDPRGPSAWIRLSILKEAHTRTIAGITDRDEDAEGKIAEVKEMPKCGFGFVTWCLFGGAG